MRNNPDKAILERAKRFETQALEDIYDRYSAGIYRYAFRLLGDVDLASDCMSETFSRFLHALKREGGPEEYLQAYLYRIAHNWVTDYYRSKAQVTTELDQEHPASPLDEPHQVVAVEMEKLQLREALSQLTPEQRQVIVLKYLEDWENEQIGQLMNKQVGAVKALQHRGIEALRRIMIRYEDVSI
jgi:RNA polymerase sigma-70 factor, ECF subfamily